MRTYIKNKLLQKRIMNFQGLNDTIKEKKFEKSNDHKTIKTK